MWLCIVLVWPTCNNVDRGCQRAKTGKLLKRLFSVHFITSKTPTTPLENLKREKFEG